MPLLYRKKLPNGTHTMEEQEIKEVDKVDLSTPVSPTGVTGGFKRYYCTACKPHKAFAGLGVASMHFGKAHKDLKEDKNSYRKWIKDGLDPSAAD